MEGEQRWPLLRFFGAVVRNPVSYSHFLEKAGAIHGRSLRYRYAGTPSSCPTNRNPSHKRYLKTDPNRLTSRQKPGILSREIPAKERTTKGSIGFTNLTNKKQGWSQRFLPNRIFSKFSAPATTCLDFRFCW